MFLYMVQTIMTKFHQINANHKIPFEEIPNLKLVVCFKLKNTFNVSKPTHVSMFFVKRKFSLEKNFSRNILIYNIHSFVCSLNFQPQEFHFMQKFRTKI